MNLIKNLFAAGSAATPTSEHKTELESPEHNADIETQPSLAGNAVAADFQRYFYQLFGREDLEEHSQDRLAALALALRDRLVAAGNHTRNQRIAERKVCYLSLEYLIGRSLSNAAINLGVDDELTRALQGIGLDWEDLAEQEHDAGLGNGGLGRLAACFLDSCATLGLPVVGYGLRYQYGMFRQEIHNGHQVEEPDQWLRYGHPWEMCRPEQSVQVAFGGRVEHTSSLGAKGASRWLDAHEVIAVPYDIPVPGYQNGIVNWLRLWSSVASDAFNLDEFNAGSYPEAVASKNAAESITMVLYPNDASENGKVLRLQQQFLLASASLQDCLREWISNHDSLADFADKHCFQLNDTHPSIAVAELMRLLIDEHGQSWESAWGITTATMAYTNHTLLPEALERWPVRMFAELLPRHLEIIYLINEQLLDEVNRHWPDDMERRKHLSLIEEGHDPMVRMAHLAVYGSFSVNGVAALHTKLLQAELFHDFSRLWPERFNNKTNGVTQRRWMVACNPALTTLLREKIGDGWIRDLDQLHKLEPLADDPGFQKRWREVKQTNKQRVRELIEKQCGVQLMPDALFDIQVKRIHEYKRQLLNTLHVIHLYLRIREGDTDNWTPRCVLIGGKAAPGYFVAKLMIKFINNVADVINNDPAARGLLQCVFLPNYSVSMMETLCAGADLSAQLSTAGKEASGTGNMKFMMNGALTIGTLDGANVEIREAVGAEHFFLFGLDAAAVAETRKDYDPNGIIANDPAFAAVMAAIEGGEFSQDEPDIFTPLVQSIRSPHDAWMTAADFRSFIDAQQQAASLYQNEDLWTHKSIMNTAASGRFSSDRTIAQYNEDIWHLNPTKTWTPTN